MGKVTRSTLAGFPPKQESMRLIGMNRTKAPLGSRSKVSLSLRGLLAKFATTRESTQTERRSNVLTAFLLTIKERFTVRGEAIER